LQVLDDRPMAFIHVEDAAAALLAAAHCLQHSPDAEWQVLNAAPEVASIGQLARTVQRLAQARGRWVRIHGVAANDGGCTFEVVSKLADAGFVAQHSLGADLGEVLDFFVRTA
jgi:nucleoside-diphosphate-sugar epimerase